MVKTVATTAEAGRDTVALSRCGINCLRIHEDCDEWSATFTALRAVKEVTRSM
jgi:hypothetical protein